jgi:hypothetical protein
MAGEEGIGGGGRAGLRVRFCNDRGGIYWVGGREWGVLSIDLRGGDLRGQTMLGTSRYTLL